MAWGTNGGLGEGAAVAQKAEKALDEAQTLRQAKEERECQRVKLERENNHLLHQHDELRERNGALFEENEGLVKERDELREKNAALFEQNGALQQSLRRHAWTSRAFIGGALALTALHSAAITQGDALAKLPKTVSAWCTGTAKEVTQDSYAVITISKAELRSAHSERDPVNLTLRRGNVVRLFPGTADKGWLAVETATMRGAQFVRADRPVIGYVREAQLIRATYQGPK